MKVDIVFPKGNEEEFISKAEKMGFQAICFVYDNKVPNIESSSIKVILASLKKDKENLYFSDKIQGFSNRNVDIVFGLEKTEKKDFLREVKSGLNQVVCKQAVKNEIKYGFSFYDIINAKDRSLILSRIMQNIKLCRKYKVEMVMGSFATKPEEMGAYHDMVAFGVVMGMHPTESKKSLNWYFK